MIKEQAVLKIALVGDSLGGGGAEKVHALLSVFFQSRGMQVSNCIFVDDVRYSYAGTLLNLGRIKHDSKTWVRKSARLWRLWRFFSETHFDYVIDFRMHYGVMQEYILTRYVFPKQTVFTVHSGVISYYLPEPAKSRIIYRGRRLVAVSEKIARLLRDGGYATDVSHIYNPVFASFPAKSNRQSEKFILAVGGMNTTVKQFDGLIRSYAISVLPLHDVKLYIMGEGYYLEQYQSLASSLGLADRVVFTGFREDIQSYFASALYTVLSSRNEGFPNVLVESLAAGTPVIAFDCFSGPSEIIRHEVNGLLVADQDWGALNRAMNRFIEEEQIYLQCKSQSRASAERFSLDNVGQQWLQYLKIDVS